MLSCPETPAFVIDEALIDQRLGLVDHIKRQAGCHVLYTLKPLVDAGVMQRMAPHVDGFAASSLFEATLAREVLGARGTVHLTTPGLRPEEIPDLAALCDYVSFNSLSQLQRFGSAFLGSTHCGLRINPKLSFAEEERYDPCRKTSKLGVAIEQVAAAARREPEVLNGLSGLHFHNNCDSKTFRPLVRTVRRVLSHLAPLLQRAHWINFGGGYLFSRPEDLSGLYEAIDIVRAKYPVDIFLEPGAALVREAGYIVSSVVDLFESDGATIAILDTTVNHMPEVYEYQYEPDVLGHRDDGRFAYVLAGSSCLAGDVFGAYVFDAPLRVGSRVVFGNAGAYTQVKAHMFNGINLPALYRLTEAGQLILRKRFTYQDFRARTGD